MLLTNNTVMLMADQVATAKGEVYIFLSIFLCHIDFLPILQHITQFNDPPTQKT